MRQYLIFIYTHMHIIYTHMHKHMHIIYTHMHKYLSKLPNRGFLLCNIQKWISTVSLSSPFPDISFFCRYLLIKNITCIKIFLRFNLMGTCGKIGTLFCLFARFWVSCKYLICTGMIRAASSRFRICLKITTQLKNCAVTSILPLKGSVFLFFAAIDRISSSTRYSPMC